MFNCLIVGCIAVGMYVHAFFTSMAESISVMNNCLNLSSINSYSYTATL